MVRQPIGGSRIDGRKPVQLASAQEPDKKPEANTADRKNLDTNLSSQRAQLERAAAEEEAQKQQMERAQRQQLQMQSVQSAKQQEELSKHLQELQRNWLSAMRQIATLAKQLEEQQRHRPLPPIENGQVKVYSLVYLAPREAAQTIESLFGTQAIRIAVDERSNALIMYGKPDSFAAVDALIDRLDKQAAPANAAEKTSPNAATVPRSLLVRIFWLADRLPESEGGQYAGDYLPQSVLDATQKLGLDMPTLVTQTVNSLAVGSDDVTSFSANAPALLYGQPSMLGCGSRLKLVGGDSVRMELNVHVSGSANCDLNGSLVTPLNHFIVLGTANSLIAQGGAPARRTCRAGQAPAVPTILRETPGLGRPPQPYSPEGGSPKGHKWNPAGLLVSRHRARTSTRRDSLLSCKWSKAKAIRLTQPSRAARGNQSQPQPNKIAGELRSPETL